MILNSSISSLTLTHARKSQSNTVEFDAAGEVAEDPTVRKPVVPFHGNISEQYLTHKQKRALKKRARKLDHFCS